ncbi:hypothetical protein [Beggiatoa leptomitoformis]|uniref:Uncharacterized protein n=1 Tax=Beggiatoa leptomitoformis TaxID=288004 RepID=A0A2N9YA25_9GAMM|nr:hypothetical protein [Beggiatoa leptomitoformis]ALG67261.1 hypothetical protein AL038_05515 [Beggiatoa leptomitoformis]AUI67316.2 hypothetical protein BLE401_00460 [Beggiatoa leptomitoformis]
MKILWVEDFGGVDDIEAMCTSIFQELVPDLRISSRTTDFRKNPEKLSKLIKNTQSAHEVMLCRHYHDFEKISEADILASIDTVLLDLNLSELVDPNAEIPKNYQHNKGGLYLYNFLIYAGFPRENIRFLTGVNIKLSELKEKYRKIHIPHAPESFEKNDVGYEKLRAWLKAQEQRPYLTLRRGIINACQFIKKLIGTDAKKIRFKEFLRNKPEINDLKTSMVDYLDTLEKFFSLAEPADKAKDYKLFVRTLAHEWEDNANVSNLGEKSKIALYIKACGIIMKEARNALAHNSINGNFDESSVAFLFIIAMRCMFELPDKPTPFERLLFSLFLEEKEIATIYNEKKIDLTKFYTTVKKTFWDSVVLDKVIKKQTDSVSFKRDCNISTKLTKEDFYKFFWLHLLTVKITNKDLMPTNTIGNNEVSLTVVHEIDVNAFYDQFNNSNSFLFHFSRHIYPYSF